MTSPQLPEDPRVLIVGAGGVGLSLAAWLAPSLPRLAVLARGASAEALRREGVRAGLPEGPLRSTPVEVLDTWDPGDRPDLLLLAVKTYSLPGLTPKVIDTWGAELDVMGVQNGLSAMELLSPFPNVLYGIATWNAWREAPGVVRYQRQGALVVGGPRGELARAWSARLGRSTPTQLTEDFTQAAWCKALINLGNSVTALAGFGARSVEDRLAIQPLLMEVLTEGVAALQAAGVTEQRLDGLPSWALLRVIAALPRWAGRLIARSQLKKLRMSSMGQDLVAGSETELEAINGAFLKLGARHGVQMPTLEAVTALARERFAEPGFVGLPIAELEAEVRARRGPR